MLTGSSWMPQKSLVVTTYDQRGQPSLASAWPMIVLALAAGVGLGVVEEVATGVVRGLHALQGEVGVELGVEGDPAPEAEHADLDARVAQPAVLHLVRFVRHGPEPTTTTAP